MRSRSTALSISRGRTNALLSRALQANSRAPPSRSTVLSQSRSTTDSRVIPSWNHSPSSQATAILAPMRESGHPGQAIVLGAPGLPLSRERRNLKVRQTRASQFRAGIRRQCELNQRQGWGAVLAGLVQGLDDVVQSGPVEADIRQAARIQARQLAERPVAQMPALEAASQPLQGA